MTIQEFACPKCSTMLPSCGAVTVDGEQCPLFQCDDCVMVKVLDDGEPMDFTLLFAVNSRGEAFDPVDDEKF
jgi:hypothetical protein